MCPGVLVRTHADKEIVNWLSGKHVLVTGASSGIGRELCENLAVVCSKLTLVARNEQKLLNFAVSLRQLQQADIAYYALDIQNVDAMKELIDKIYDTDCEQIDAFINCAGGSHIYDTIEHLSHSDIEQIFRTNGEAPIHWLRELLPRMRTQESDNLKRAHIILLSSRSAERVLPNLVVYGSAKGAIEKLVEGLRREYAKHQIVFTVINPGSINTPFTASWKQKDRDDHNEQSMNVSEVALLIIYILTMQLTTNKISFESIEQWKTELGVL